MSNSDLNYLIPVPFEPNETSLAMDYLEGLRIGEFRNTQIVDFETLERFKQAGQPFVADSNVKRIEAPQHLLKVEREVSVLCRDGNNLIWKSIGSAFVDIKSNVNSPASQAHFPKATKQRFKKTISRIFLHLISPLANYLVTQRKKTWPLELLLWSSRYEPYEFSRHRFSLRFTFSDQRHPIDVPIRVYNHRVARKWWRNFTKDLQKEKREIWNHGVFYGDLFVSHEQMSKDLDQALTKLTEFDSRFGDFIGRELNEKLLNQIHGLKERLISECEKSGRYPEIPVLWLNRINVVVHQYEASGFSRSGSVTIIPWRPTQFKMRWMDYLYFTRWIGPGHLYIDYGTNGVSLIDAYKHDHIESPVPQRTLNSGIYLSFRGRQEFQDLQSLNLWCAKHKARSVFDLRSALGYIPVARIDNIREVEKLRDQIRGATRVDVLFNNFTA